MKTSTKILFGFISIIGLSMLSILIFAKSSLINYENNSVNGDGNIVVRTHNIGEVAFFQANYNYEIFIKKGEPSLVIETDENIQAFLRPNINRTEHYREENVTKEGMNIGRIEHINLHPSNGIKVYLTTPSLEEINLRGHSKVTFEDTIESDNFRVSARGSSELNLLIKTNDLEVATDGHSVVNVKGQARSTDISSSGSSDLTVDVVDTERVNIAANGHSTVKIKGQTQQLKVDLNGSSSLMAKHLISDDASILANAHSNVSVHAKHTLNVEADGSATITYSGNPQVTKEVSGSATLNATEEK